MALAGWGVPQLSLKPGHGPNFCSCWNRRVPLCPTIRKSVQRGTTGAAPGPPQVARCWGHSASFPSGPGVPPPFSGLTSKSPLHRGIPSPATTSPSLLPCSGAGVLCFLSVSSETEGGGASLHFRMGKRWQSRECRAPVTPCRGAAAARALCSWLSAKLGARVQ